MKKQAERKTKLSIKNWAIEDRPREKMLVKGKSALSDAELLAILIRSGNSDDSALSLSQKILHDVDNSLVKLSSLSIQSLIKYKGIGGAKAITIAAALELGRRRREATVKEVKSIISSVDIYEYMQSSLTDLNYEEFWVIFLNATNKIISKTVISQGGISETLVDSKKIFKLALENNAVNIILSHNHPSGQVNPSETDITLTKKIKNGAETLDIKLLDHIIIGQSGYFSFTDEGLI